MNNKERTLARENIVKILYQNNISQNDIPTIISTFVEKRKFVLKLLNANMDKIDNFIENNANITELEMSVVDRSILRMSVCEFLFRKDIPKKVIMDESIKIAKKFSSELSFKFINKILDKLLID